MGAKITTAQDFAIELKDYVSMNALSGKELKSLASSVGYSLGFLNGLFNFHKRGILTTELVYLNAFIGTVTIRLCFSDCEGTQRAKADEVIQIFTQELLSQWLPDSAPPGGRPVAQGIVSAVQMGLAAEGYI